MLTLSCSSSAVALARNDSLTPTPGAGATSMAFHFRSSALIPARRSPGSRRCPEPPRACVPLPAAQEQDLLGLDSARREGGAYVLEHVLRDELARTRVEELRLGLRG